MSRVWFDLDCRGRRGSTRQLGRVEVTRKCTQSWCEKDVKVQGLGAVMIPCLGLHVSAACGV